MNNDEAVEPVCTGDSGRWKWNPVLADEAGARERSRCLRSMAKQTMIQQTLARLLPVADANDVWVMTNHWLIETISDQLPEVLRGFT